MHDPHHEQHPTPTNPQVRDTPGGMPVDPLDFAPYGIASYLPRWNPGE